MWSVDFNVGGKNNLKKEKKNWKKYFNEHCIENGAFTAK